MIKKFLEKLSGKNPAETKKAKPRSRKPSSSSAPSDEALSSVQMSRRGILKGGAATLVAPQAMETAAPVAQAAGEYAKKRFHEVVLPQFLDKLKKYKWGDVSELFQVHDSHYHFIGGEGLELTELKNFLSTYFFFFRNMREFIHLSPDLNASDFMEVYDFQQKVLGFDGEQSKVSNQTRGFDFKNMDIYPGVKEIISNLKTIEPNDTLKTIYMKVMQDFIFKIKQRSREIEAIYEPKLRTSENVVGNKIPKISKDIYKEFKEDQYWVRFSLRQLVTALSDFKSVVSVSKGNAADFNRFLVNIFEDTPFPNDSKEVKKTFGFIEVLGSDLTNLDNELSNYGSVNSQYDSMSIVKVLDQLNALEGRVKFFKDRIERREQERSEENLSSKVFEFKQTENGLGALLFKKNLTETKEYLKEIFEGKENKNVKVYAGDYEIIDQGDGCLVVFKSPVIFDLSLSDLRSRLVKSREITDSLIPDSDKEDLASAEEEMKKLLSRLQVMVEEINIFIDKLNNGVMV